MKTIFALTITIATTATSVLMAILVTAVPAVAASFTPFSFKTVYYQVGDRQ